MKVTATNYDLEDIGRLAVMYYKAQIAFHNAWDDFDDGKRKSYETESTALLTAMQALQDALAAHLESEKA